MAWGDTVELQLAKDWAPCVSLLKDGQITFRLRLLLVKILRFSHCGLEISRYPVKLLLSEVTRSAVWVIRFACGIVLRHVVNHTRTC